MTLAEPDRRLVRLFAACVLGEWDEVRTLRRSAPAGEPDRRWREAILMVHVFAGFPRGVETYDVLAACGGLGELDPDETTEPASGGAELFERIYADASDDVRGLLLRHNPMFGRWVLDHAYGRVLCRTGLAADRRELLACAALAVLGQDRQLASHARGAVRCGATPDEVAAVVTSLTDRMSPDRAESARAIVQRFARA